MFTRVTRRMVLLSAVMVVLSSIGVSSATASRGPRWTPGLRFSEYWELKQRYEDRLREREIMLLLARKNRDLWSGGGAGPEGGDPTDDGCHDEHDDDEDKQEKEDDDQNAPGPAEGDQPLVPSEMTLSPNGLFSAPTSVQPIYYTGAIAERPVDFELPSRGGIYWKHVRYYNQYVDSDVLTEQGYNWNYSYWSYLEEDGSDVNYWRDTLHVYTFESPTSSGVWEKDKRIGSRLYHNHTHDPDHTFRLQKPNGTIWLFCDFHSSWGDQAGKLWFVIGMYGHVSQTGDKIEGHGNVMQIVRDDGLKIHHDQSGSATAATVEVTSTALVLKITGGPNAGTETLMFASYATIDELVDAANDLDKGWVAEVAINGATASAELAARSEQTAFGIGEQRALRVGPEDNAGRINIIVDPSGHYIRYSYVSQGQDEMLDEINIYEDDDETDAKRIGRISFTYWQDVQGIHADCGSERDLIQVMVEARSTDDDNTLKIERKNHYRYYKGTYENNDGKGKAHQLRMILRSRAVKRATSTGSGINDVLAASNSAIDDYANSLFEYFDDQGADAAHDKRVKKETVQSGAGCCTGPGTAPGDYEYVYEYTTEQNPGRNDWFLQTKETRPDGSIKYVEHNEFAEPVVVAFFQDDDDNAKVRRFWRFERDSDAGDACGMIDRIYTPMAITDYDPDTANRSGDGLTYDADGIVFVMKYEDDSLLYRHKLTKRYKYSEVDGEGEPSTSEGDMVVFKTWETSGGAWDYRSRVQLEKCFIKPDRKVDEGAGTNRMLL